MKSYPQIIAGIHSHCLTLTADLRLKGRHEALPAAAGHGASIHHQIVGIIANLQAAEAVQSWAVCDEQQEDAADADGELHDRSQEIGTSDSWNRQVIAIEMCFTNCIIAANAKTEKDRFFFVSGNNEKLKAFVCAVVAQAHTHLDKNIFFVFQLFYRIRQGFLKFPTPNITS